MSPDRASRPLLLGILAVAAIIYLLGNERVQLFDRDEPRYAECAREMLKSGDWVVPRYLGELRTHKPPLIYWCQAASMAVLGRFGETGAARLPSAVSMIAAAILMAMFIRREVSLQLAAASILVFCTSVLVIAAAKLAITDATLLLWICIGQGALYSVWRKPTTLAAIIFWLSTALAGLTKGPVVLAVHAATLIALFLLEKNRTVRWWRYLLCVAGLAVLAALGIVALVIFVPQGQLRAAFSASLTRLIVLTEEPRLATLIIAILVSLDLAVLDIVKKRGYLGWWNLRPILGIVILAIVISPWLILVHHRAPDFLPRLFSRAGRYAAGGAEGHAAPPGYYLLLIWGLFFPWSILLPAAIHTAWKNRPDDPLARFALAASIGPWLVMELVSNKLPFYILPSFPALAILVGMLIERKRFFRGALIGGSAMAIATVILYGIVLPRLPSLAASRAIGRQLADLGAGGSTKVAMIDYREPSLAFYQGGGAWESAANDLSGPHPPQWAVITSDAWNGLTQSVRDNYQTLGQSVPVWMYNDGWRSSKLLIIRRSFHSS